MVPGQWREGLQVPSSHSFHGHCLVSFGEQFRSLFGGQRHAAIGPIGSSLEMLCGHSLVVLLYLEGTVWEQREGLHCL